MSEKVKITVMRTAHYDDLSALYENPIEHACFMREGMTFISKEAKMPDGFCESAWSVILPFVMTLAYGGSDIYDGWMKDKNSAMISCNDGFRPVSFFLQTDKERK
ncbi:MAG: TIGR04076 family protein [Synergistes sp.]|nr:TIGR04076 family protein [Synergistes sp.]